MAKHLYDVIDFNYKGVARNTAFRSLANICWTLRSPSDLCDFLHPSAQPGIIGIGGHRSIEEGTQASLYNDITESAVFLCHKRLVLNVNK